MLYLLLISLVGVGAFMLTSFVSYLIEQYGAAREARHQAELAERAAARDQDEQNGGATGATTKTPRRRGKQSPPDAPAP